MSCSEARVLGLVPGILGCLEASEASKCILNIGELVVNKILFIDLLRNSFEFAAKLTLRYSDFKGIIGSIIYRKSQSSLNRQILVEKEKS
ncbi:MAG: hypothetical protein EU532_13275 [Promethearchaeota archaeon]|nr:MAG: hypothetical protein EU532_13275 [Candidatus Lokiarchaeota archaeon]